MKGAIFYLRNDMDAGLGAFRACSLGTLPAGGKTNAFGVGFSKFFLKRSYRTSFRKLILDMEKIEFVWFSFLSPVEICTTSNFIKKNRKTRLAASNAI